MATDTRNAHTTRKRRRPAWVDHALAIPGARLVAGGEHGFWTVSKGDKWMTDADAGQGVWHGEGEYTYGKDTTSNTLRWFDSGDKS